MYGVIRTDLERADLHDEGCMDVVDVAVDGALEYVLEYAQEVSAELVSSNSYSEAMVAGLFVKKIKTLLGELDDNL